MGPGPPHRVAGRLFGYFARKATGGKAGWPESYFAVSKSPWLEALASWETCGAWTWGCSFSASGALCITGCVGDKPFHGDYPEPVSICAMNTDWRGRDLWNEVKRGWRTAGGSTTGAALADRPGLVMLRDRPGEGGTVTLGLIHNGVDFARGGMEGVRLEYFLQHERDGVTPLPRTVWADWDRQGRLLSATSDGAVEILEWRNGKLERIWWEDLRAHSPNPEAAPEWAGRW